MASSSSPSIPRHQNTCNKTKNNIPNPPFDPASSPDTTFVQADPSNFRAVVQKLTGAATTTHDASAAGVLTGKSIKLHERRQSTARKLEIKLSNGVSCAGDSSSVVSGIKRGFLEMVMVSPVSPLDVLAGGRGSPRTPRSPLMEEKEEERAIAEKGFYLHPSPLSTPRGCDPPELLPLFPLRSPRDGDSSH